MCPPDSPAQRHPFDETHLMKSTLAVLALLLIGVPAIAQSPGSSTANPLPALKEQLQHVLSEANLPFSESQDKAIVLMMEDRRKASEDLFGDLMNFSAGPTQGQEADR